MAPYAAGEVMTPEEKAQRIVYKFEHSGLTAPELRGAISDAIAESVALERKKYRTTIQQAKDALQTASWYVVNGEDIAEPAQKAADTAGLTTALNAQIQALREIDYGYQQEKV